MISTAFDSLAAARDLEAAGVERSQADAIAGVVRQASTADQGELATGADIRELRAELRLMRWAMGFIAALVLAMAGRIFGAI